jgi:hypothetical protein
MSAFSIASISLGFGCRVWTDVPGETRLVMTSLLSAMLATWAYSGGKVVTIFNAFDSLLSATGIVGGIVGSFFCS